MRALIFLLVIGNLLFLGYAQGYFGTSAGPDAGRLAQQLNPDRVRIVASGEPPAGAVMKTAFSTPAVQVANTGTSMPATVAVASTAVSAPATALSAAAAQPAAAPVEACASWSGLTLGEADRLAKAVSGKSPAVRVQRRAEPASVTAWWVLIPPLPSKADADRKAGELKQLGITDFFIVQDPGPNHLGISLGVFSAEAAANTQLEILRGKGVRTAKVRPKTAGEPTASVELRGAAAQLDAAKAVFADRKPGECSSPALAAVKAT